LWSRIPPPVGADVVVNATPIGTWPDADKTPVPSCAGARVVYDLLYNPADTRLLRQARDTRRADDRRARRC
jgi:shikimate 5-dehydrogenase